MKTSAESKMIVIKSEEDFFTYIENRMKGRGFEILEIAPSRPDVDGNRGQEGSEQKDGDSHG